MVGAAKSRITDATVQALVEARHDDPFAVLGPHETPDGVVIRALVPGATGSKCSRRARHGRGRAEIAPCGGPVRGRAQGPAGLVRLHPARPQRGRDLGPARPLPFPARPRRDGRLPDPRRYPSRGCGNASARTRSSMPGAAGVHFAVWAPNAARVSVVGDFNGWDGRRNPMRRRGGLGVWEIFIPDLGRGRVYKYELAAPTARCCRSRPIPSAPAPSCGRRTPRVVRRIDDFSWTDARMAATARARAVGAGADLHPGSPSRLLGARRGTTAS